jgi:hypothetical protein
LYHRSQVFRLFAYGRVPAPSQLFFHFMQLRRHPLTHRSPQHHKAPSLPRLPAAMREAKEVKGLRLSRPSPIAIAGGEPPKLDQSGLLGMQLQAELGKSLLEIHEELLSLVAMLNPTTKSSAYRTAMICPCVSFSTAGFTDRRSAGRYWPTAG